MNVNLLIDSIVRQTTVLVAQLATAAGGRAPLAHVAGQVFFELVRELKTHGLGNKVIADMFGLTLRTYHDRVRRTSESRTDRGRSLWEAVLTFVRERQMVTRAELLRRFRADDEATVRGVLSDLVDGGLVFKSGRVDHTAYRAATDAETEVMLRDRRGDSTAGVVWVWLHQHGPARLDELARELCLTEEIVRSALTTLVNEARVRITEGELYHADHCIIPYDDELGWEAAVFDHFQSVVTAIGAKVTQGRSRAQLRDRTGGSTYHFDVYRGHPSEERVLGLLQTVRELASELRTHLDETARPTDAKPYRVVFYVGQNLTGFDEQDSVEAIGEDE